MHSGTLAAGLALLLCCAPALGHGGAYNGPGGGGPPGGGGAGDSVPPPAPGGAGSSGGSGASTSPPPAGGGATGGVPSTPSRPSAAGPARPTPATAGADETVWQRWWGFNQHAYLDVKGAVHGAVLVPGSDSFFLGHAPADHARDRMLPSAERVRAEVVPALRRALVDERDADMVTGALIALAKIGDTPGEALIAAVIEPFLADRNQEIAETAAIALGILASPAAVPLLEGLLRDGDAARARVGRPAGVPLRTRAFAAYGLGLIAHRSSDDDLRAHVVRALIETFEPATGLATPDVAVACLGALGLVPLAVGGEVAGAPWSAREPQLAWLHARLADEGLRDATRAHVPVVAARLLVDRAGGERARHVAAWCDLLARRGTPQALRQGLVLALGRVANAGRGAADAGARVALLEASRGGGDLDLRHFALVGLGQSAARPGAGAAPWEGRDLVRAYLLDTLHEGSTLDRPWAALALGALGRGLADAGLEVEPSVDADLRSALARARVPYEVGALAIACGMRRDPQAVAPILAQLAQVADDDTRGYLCLALGMIGAPEGLDRVREVVRGARYRPALLRQAAIALGLLGDKHLVPELCQALAQAGSLAAQASVASGLGAIGDARSIAPLIAMLSDRAITPRARAFAAVALGIVADKEPRPWNAKLAIGTHYRANTVTLTDGRGAGILEIL